MRSPDRYNNVNLRELQGENWSDLLKEVVTFDSVEEFWGVYVRHLLRFFLHHDFMPPIVQTNTHLHHLKL